MSFSCYLFFLKKKLHHEFLAESEIALSQLERWYYNFCSLKLLTKTLNLLDQWYWLSYFFVGSFDFINCSTLCLFSFGLISVSAVQFLKVILDGNTHNSGARYGVNIDRKDARWSLLHMRSFHMQILSICGQISECCTCLILNFFFFVIVSYHYSKHLITFSDSRF